MDKTPKCKICGEEKEWDECWQCGGEGYGEEFHDCGEDCCCCLYPDDGPCPNCAGRGGEWVCPNVEQHFADEQRKAKGITA